MSKEIRCGTGGEWETLKTLKEDILRWSYDDLKKI